MRFSLDFGAVKMLKFSLLSVVSGIEIGCFWYLGRHFKGLKVKIPSIFQNNPVR